MQLTLLANYNNKLLPEYRELAINYFSMRYLKLTPIQHVFSLTKTNFYYLNTKYEIGMDLMKRRIRTSSIDNIIHILMNCIYLYEDFLTAVSNTIVFPLASRVHWQYKKDDKIVVYQLPPTMSIEL